MRIPALVLGLGCIIAVAQADDSLKDALTEGDVSLDLRYRLEHVDQDGFAEKANASTARLRLGYTTGRWRDLQAHVDFEVLRPIGGESYNSTANGRTQYPTVPDPVDEEVNQAYLAYHAPCKTKVKLGRQRIKLDNDRFVGNVGWRQLEQTFDAFTVDSKYFDRVSIYAGHVNNANRVFGEHHPVATSADMDLDMNLLRLGIETGAGTLALYGHQIEIEDMPAASHRNLGVRFTGKHEVSDRTDLIYAAEFADQSDYEDAPSTVDADYLLLELGAQIDRWNVKGGYEKLGGDGTYAFQTPLATLHAFNGWADRFVVGGTPAAGLQDRYVGAARKFGRTTVKGVFHEFSADQGSTDYGRELDLLVSRPLGKLVGTLKYANYDADDATAGPAALDTEIFWLVLHYKGD